MFLFKINTKQNHLHFSARTILLIMVLSLTGAFFITASFDNKIADFSVRLASSSARLAKYFWQVEKALASTSSNLRGWFWAENAGWISANCYNDYDGDGVFENCCSGGSDCPTEITNPNITDYGLNYNTTSNVLSGYSWSEGMGWICFGSTCGGSSPDGYSAWACVGKRNTDGSCYRDCAENFNSPAGTCTNNDADSNLQGHWKLNTLTGANSDVITDETGNNNGAIKPSAAAGPYLVKGEWNNALKFDGSDDYVDLGNNASLQIATGSAEAWIKIGTAGAGASYRGIVGKRNAYGLRVKDNEFGTYDWGAGVWRGTGVLLNDNKWHHVAGTFQSGVTNGTILYLDGEPKLTTTITVSSQISNAAIGSGNPGTGENINALIDNAAIYNRVKTAEEIWDDSHIEISGWAKYVNLGEDGWIKLKHQNTGGNYWGSYLNNYSDGGGFYTMGGYGWNNTASDSVGMGWVKGGYTSSQTADNPIAPVAFDSFRVTNYGCSLGVPSMYLQWTPSAWAEYYNYYRCQSDTSGNCGLCTYNTNPYPVLSGSCDSSSCANTDTQPTIATNTGYCYKLQASNPTGNTWATNNPPTYPHPFWKQTSFCPVSGVYTEGTTCGRVAIVWPKNMDATADGYNVYRSNYFVSSYDGCSTLTDSKCKIVAQFGEALSQKNLVANWKMNEASWSGAAGEVIDSSSYGNHGAAVGNATISASGKFKNAGSFNGSSQYVEVADSASLDITSAITLEAWVKFNTVSSAYQAIIGKRDSTLSEVNYTFRTGISGNMDELEFYFYNNGWHVYTTNNANLAISTWYHLVVTYAGATVKIYKDGVLLTGSCTLGTCNVAMLADNNKLGLGRPGDKASEYLNGLIDNVAIYSRAKTAEEIYLDYKARQLNEMDVAGVNGCWVSNNTDNGHANYNTVFEANTKNKLTTCTDSALCCQYRDNSVNPKVKYYYRITVTSPGGEAPASTAIITDTDSDGTIDCLDPDSGSYLKGCAQTLCYPKKREKEE